MEMYFLGLTTGWQEEGKEGSSMEKNPPGNLYSQVYPKDLYLEYKLL